IAEQVDEVPEVGRGELVALQDEELDRAALRAHAAAPVARMATCRPTSRMDLARACVRASPPGDATMRTSVTLSGSAMDAGKGAQVDQAGSPRARPAFNASSGVSASTRRSSGKAVVSSARNPSMLPTV